MSDVPPFASVENAPVRADADLLIIGGGMTGMACALACAQAGLESILVDAADLNADAPGAAGAPPDPRASAIAYANMRMLDALGVGETLRADAGRMERILVTDGRIPDAEGLPLAVDAGPGAAFLHFDAADLPEAAGEPLAFMVENARLRRALWAAVQDTPGITVKAPARVEAIALDGPLAQVALESGETLAAPLVVGAEAKAALVRRAAGIRVLTHDYGQSGVVTAVRAEHSHGNVAHEYFLPHGPFAILPLPDNRASLVWTEKTEAAQAAVALPDEAFQREIQRRFGDFLGAVTVEGPRYAFPLRLSLAEQFIAPRAVLVGDAARTVHPIAGQGFNLALKDCAALAEILQQAARLGQDVGGAFVLEEYQRWRRFDSVLMALATDGLNRLFSNDEKLARWMRNTGMAAVNATRPLTRLLARDAGADLGQTPKLLRGEPLG